MSRARDRLLENFADEVDTRGPGGKHARLQKLCGRYLAYDGGPIRRNLKDIHAEQKVRLGGKKQKVWPADILADWGSFTEVVEVQSVSPTKHVTVEYRSLDDANEKLDYLEETGMIAPAEARLVRERAGDAARIGVNATSFWFEPTRKNDLHRLVGKGWNMKCESELERKFRLARKSDSVVSFCVPHYSYRKVLAEIRENPDLKVGLIYPFVERDGHIRIAGAIPVFQGIDLKEYRNVKWHE